MSDYLVETSMLYGALVGAAANLVVITTVGHVAGAWVMALFAFLAVAFDVVGDSPNA